MRSVFLIAAILAATVFVGAASADYKTGNPLKCGLPSKQDCARNAAVWTLRGAMAQRLGRPPYYWTSNVTCTQTSASLLKWSCHWGSPGTGASAVVTFRALSSGWHRYVTNVKCDDPTKTNPPGCAS